MIEHSTFRPWRRISMRPFRRSSLRWCDTVDFARSSPSARSPTQAFIPVSVEQDVCDPQQSMSRSKMVSRLGFARAPNISLSRRASSVRRFDMNRTIILSGICVTPKSGKTYIASQWQQVFAIASGRSARPRRPSNRRFPKPNSTPCASRSRPRRGGLEKAQTEAKALAEKARALVGEAKDAYRAALAPYREACRKAGVECEYEGGRSANVSEKVSFLVEKTTGRARDGEGPAQDRGGDPAGHAQGVDQQGRLRLHGQARRPEGRGRQQGR